MLLQIVLAAALQLPHPAGEGFRTAEPLLVPKGRPVLLDGRVDGAEWDDAARADLAGGARLLLKHDATYVYAAVVLPAPQLFGVNLYVAPLDTGSAYLNLHASARLGERVGSTSSWPEWQWWNNVDWAANVTRFNGFEGQRFLPDVVKEFQIAIARWPGAAFRLSLDLETPDGTEYPVTTALRADGMAWYVGHLAP